MDGALTPAHFSGRRASDQLILDGVVCLPRASGQWRSFWQSREHDPIRTPRNSRGELARPIAAGNAFAPNSGILISDRTGL